MNIKSSNFSIILKWSIVLLFFIFQFCFAYYIFNYTPQQKNPSSLQILPQPSTRVIYTIERDLVTGAPDGTIFYFFLDEFTPSLLPKRIGPQMPSLIWKHDLASPINSIVMSPSMAYVSASTARGDIYLLLSSNGSLVWKKNLGRQSVVEGIGGTFGDVGASAFFQTIVVSSSKESQPEKTEGSMLYVFTPASSEPFWTFPCEASRLMGVPSANGNRVFAGDSDGNAFYFNWKSNIPLWEKNLGAPISHVRIAYNGNKMAVALEKGNPNILVFDKNGNQLSSFYVPEKIENLFVSFDVSTVYVITERTVYGFSEKTWKYTLPEKIESVFIPPHGNYVLVQGKNFYELYYGRTVPLWQKEQRALAFCTTPNGEFTVLSGEGTVEIYDNLNMTPIGSRVLWGIWFCIFFLLFLFVIPKRHIPTQKKVWVIALLAGISGIVWSLQSDTLIDPVGGAFIIGMVCLVASLVAVSGEGSLFDILLGALAGVITGLVSGTILAIAYWVLGAEMPLNQEFFFIAIGSLKMAFTHGTVASVLAFIVSRIIGDRFG
jgi:outer membrane protein assembly factor BamB